MDRKTLELLIAEVVTQLPGSIRENIKNVEFIIEDLPHPSLSRQFGNNLLLGLYQGIPLPKRGEGYTFVLPDRIVLYQKNLERVVGEDNVWREKIREVVLHEIGHYFGFNEPAIQELMEQLDHVKEVRPMDDFSNYWKWIQEVFHNDEHMMNHTRKVFGYCVQILPDFPTMSEQGKRMTLLAAILHDIGILEAAKKYGSRMGKYQHIEGPPIARTLMMEAHECPEVIERVTFIIGNHHHLFQADGIDFQILLEADMLVNLANERIVPERLAAFIERFFKTTTGKRLARDKYLSPERVKGQKK
ncbi:MAG: metallopeptidase family protein [Candidatus Atribacteria bacterium]|nr:metallopeptidase family protein [Candidatus Atribacteria bacterium]